MNSCNCIQYNTEHGALFTFTYNLCTLYVYISMYSYLKKNIIRKSAMESATAAQNPTNQRSHTNERKNDDDLAMMKKKKKKTQNNTYIS